MSYVVPGLAIATAMLTAIMIISPTLLPPLLSSLGDQYLRHHNLERRVLRIIRFCGANAAAQEQNAELKHAVRRCSSAPVALLCSALRSFTF